MHVCSQQFRLCTHKDSCISRSCVQAAAPTFKHDFGKKKNKKSNKLSCQSKKVGRLFADGNNKLDEI